MFIYLDIKIPHLQIAHQGGNLDVGNIKTHRLDLQWRDRLHSYMWMVWMDGMGLDGYHRS